MHLRARIRTIGCARRSKHGCCIQPEVVILVCNYLPRNRHDGKVFLVHIILAELSSIGARLAIHAAVKRSICYKRAAYTVALSCLPIGIIPVIACR